MREKQTIIGQRIEELMKRNGMNLRQVGQAVGVSYQAVQRWIAGDNKPKPDMLVRLANLFGVDLDFLMGRKDMAPRTLRTKQDQLAQFQPNSEERAEEIISIALNELGWNIQFTPASKEKYLKGSLSDEEFYRLVREQLFVMIEQARAVFQPEKKMRTDPAHA